MLKVQKVFDKEKTEVMVLHGALKQPKRQEKEAKEMLQQRVNLVRKKLKGQEKDADEQLEKKPKHLNQVWTLTLDTPKPLFLFCFVSYLTQRGDDVHKDTRITEKKRFQQDDVMQSKVVKQGLARPSTLMLHCCTSTAQLALSADSWGSKLKAIICKLAHNFIG